MPWIISSCFESMGEENCVLYRVRAQSRVSGLVRFRMNYACFRHYRIELFRCSYMFKGAVRYPESMRWPLSFLAPGHAVAQIRCLGDQQCYQR